MNHEIAQAIQELVEKYGVGPGYRIGTERPSGTEVIMAKQITAAQGIKYDRQTTQIELVGGVLSKRQCALLTRALNEDLATTEPAGPGWGTHNAVLMGRMDMLGYPWAAQVFGDFLVTLEDADEGESQYETDRRLYRAWRQGVERTLPQ